MTEKLWPLGFSANVRLKAKELQNPIKMTQRLDLRRDRGFPGPLFSDKPARGLERRILIERRERAMARTRCMRFLRFILSIGVTILVFFLSYATPSIGAMSSGTKVIRAEPGSHSWTHGAPSRHYGGHGRWEHHRPHRHYHWHRYYYWPRYYYYWYPPRWYYWPRYYYFYDPWWYWWWYW